jgi:hypothetical protein
MAMAVTAAVGPDCPIARAVANYAHSCCPVDICGRKNFNLIVIYTSKCLDLAPNWVIFLQFSTIFSGLLNYLWPVILSR